MCGIAGIFNFNSKPVDEASLSLMRDTLIHRGPDFGDNYIENNLGLAHRRLSIIDLSNNGNQPMISDNSRYVIVYNGEIYNYQELRRKLHSSGHQVNAASDTKVLLEMFSAYGVSMLNELQGMFAFAVWDKHEKELYLIKDRVGIKPLFYIHNEQQLLFASEAKSFFKCGYPLEIDEDSLNELILYRFASGKATIFKNVFKVLPGHYLKIKTTGDVEIVQWWNLSEKIKQHPVIKNPVEWFHDTFNKAVSSHIISDVPVGVLLSGGLDSGSICASLYEQGVKEIQTFNVGFKDFVDDESAVAAKLSALYGYNYHSILVEDDDLSENLSIANYVHDEPLIHQNEPQLVAISRYAKKHVTVLLSGEGADEFLGGYVRYKPLQYYRHRKLINFFLASIPHSFKSLRIKKLQRYYAIDDYDAALLLNASNSYPKDFESLGLKITEVANGHRLKILNEAKHMYPHSARRQAMYLDQHTYLRSLNARNDRTTMAASIECRVPFLDHRLMEGLGTLDDKWFFTGKKSKFILKQAFQHILPNDTLKFRKIGFSVPWLHFIFNKETLNHHWEKMEETEIFSRGMLQYFNIKKMKEDRKKGDLSNEMLLRQFFFLSLWWKQYYQYFGKKEMNLQATNPLYI